MLCLFAAEVCFAQFVDTVKFEIVVKLCDFKWRNDSIFPIKVYNNEIILV